MQELLADELAYTTVLTILRTLEEKGHVMRSLLDERLGEEGPR